ncbi:MAG: 3-dehydroquinate synthase, partial [Planctomycetes bacterium]|nr:3-dehydroquinate synthase [Planctomycetota bacterium]
KFVVTDSNVVKAGHLETLMSDSDAPVFVIDPAGETSKTIDTAVAIVETMEKAKLGRDSVVIALGGGTVGDIAGFAAAIFKRGVPVVQIPTTPVAQADSSVGGKTGVDSSVSKNAFGAFWQPAAVHIDVATLKTLDDRVYRAGLIESVKHALIADSDYFDFLEENLQAILDRDESVLEQIAVKNCSIKASVVEEDPTEQNKRRILNYGHTIGHAVESASQFELYHGESVAIGILGAILIEKEMGLVDDNRETRVTDLLGRLSMPIKIPSGLERQNLIELIKHDKKAVNQWPRFVLLESMGTALCRKGQWAHEVAEELVEKTIDKLY